MLGPNGFFAQQVFATAALVALGTTLLPRAWAVCDTAATSAVLPPSFEPKIPNSNYIVYFDGVPTVVIEQGCEGISRYCKRRTTNNIASVTMKQAEGGSYVPINVVVEKFTYTPPASGTGWNIRPSHYQDIGIVTGVNADQLDTAKSISFTVTKPCQLSVELIGEVAMFGHKNNYWGFPALILAINPPESSWPQQKPTPAVDPYSGDVICISATPGRNCILATPSADCSPEIVPTNTDIYFTSRLSKVFQWGDGCGMVPKKFELSKGSSAFLDEDVVVFARIRAVQPNTGVFGYGVLSGYHMHGNKNEESATGLIFLNQFATVIGPVLLDATFRNILASRNSTVAWTKSFAWAGETDGVTLWGIGHQVHDNFFKVQDDVLKAYYTDTIYRNNIIWHGTIGKAITLSWGNWGENQVDRTSTTQIIDTYIIQDYNAFDTDKDLDPEHPPELALQAKRILTPALIASAHSMDNSLGLAVSPLRIDGLKVEGVVGLLFAITTGYLQLGGTATWQASNGCGGDVNLKIDNLDLSRVVWMQRTNFAGGCDVDYSYSGITNAVCLCTSDLCSAESDSYCRVNLDFGGSHIDSNVAGVPRLGDMFVLGSNTAVQGITGNFLI